MTSIGVISDTHGLLRPEALEALRGVERIIHAGDIGIPTVLDGLRSIAEIVAIKGNNDRDDWARGIPETAEVKIGALKLYIIHNVNDLRFDPAASGYRVVVSGHSHSPSINERDGVMYLNPGSAGPRRFKLPVAVARLTIDGASVAAEIVELDIPADRGKKTLTSYKRRHIKNSTF